MIEAGHCRSTRLFEHERASEASIIQPLEFPNAISSSAIGGAIVLYFIALLSLSLSVFLSFSLQHSSTCCYLLISWAAAGRPDDACYIDRVIFDDDDDSGLVLPTRRLNPISSLPRQEKQPPIESFGIHLKLFF